MVREWNYFLAGETYNVSCQVLGSRPSATTNVFIEDEELPNVNTQVRPLPGSNLAGTKGYIKH